MLRNASSTAKRQRKFTLVAIRRDFQQNKILFLMVLPVLAYFVVFHYMPMTGLLMAFENYKPKLGIWHSPMVGLDSFRDFFQSIYAWRTIRNTLAISGLELVITFPVTILFALLLNEVTNKHFKRSIQTISYMPHFISMVVVAGIITDFCASRGVLGQLMGSITGKPVNLLGKPEYWRPVYILSGLWKELGFSSIIYVAALAGVDTQLYEAAAMDGAGRLRQVIHVTLPGISSTIVIMLILKVGGLMSVGYEKTILLYNAQVYETADIISSYVYRKGLQEFNYGYSTAVGLFNSVINFILLTLTNTLSRKISETSLF